MTLSLSWRRREEDQLLDTTEKTVEETDLRSIWDDVAIILNSSRTLSRIMTPWSGPMTSGSTPIWLRSGMPFLRSCKRQLAKDTRSEPTAQSLKERSLALLLNTEHLSQETCDQAIQGQQPFQDINLSTHPQAAQFKYRRDTAIQMSTYHRRDQGTT